MTFTFDPFGPGRDAAGAVWGGVRRIPTPTPQSLRRHTFGILLPGRSAKVSPRQPAAGMKTSNNQTSRQTSPESLVLFPTPATLPSFHFQLSCTWLLVPGTGSGLEERDGPKLRRTRWHKA